jgi:hypothetical protein
MKQYDKKYIRTCYKWAARKTIVYNKNRVPLGTNDVGIPMEYVAIYILGPPPFFFFFLID